MKSRGKKKDSYPLRRSKAHERNLKNFKMLVAYDLFQKDVVELRKRLGIGPNGIAAEDPKTNWIEWAEIQGDEILNSKRFLEQEDRIARQFADGKISLRQRNRHMKLWYSKAPKLDLFSSVDVLIEKFYLPINYKQAIIFYIISNEIGRVPHKNWEPNKVPGWNDSDRARALSISIYSQLAKDELNELNDYIKWIGKDNLPQYRDFENVDEAVEIKKHRSEKYVDDKGKLRKPSFADLAEEYLGSPTKQKRAKGIVYDFEQQQKRRFTKRPKK